MKRTRILSLLLCLLLLASLLPPTSAAEQKTSAYKKSRIIVSLGDSYASGEGVEAFYGQYASMEEKCRDEDWLAHRSTYAWSGQLRLPAVRGTMAENRGKNWFFVASSGATTEHLKRTGDTVVDSETGRKEGQQTKEYDRDWVSGRYNLPGQLDVFYDNPDLDRFAVDYVTVSIGGNDVDFVGILTEAATHTALSTALYDAIDDKLDHFYDKGSTYYKLRDAYGRIAEAAPNATILVTGYPELLEYNGKGLLFNRWESQYIDRAVRIFNLRIRSLVNECKAKGMKIEFVSVEEAFRGHQAYSDDPYLNEIIIGSRDQDLQYWSVTSSYSMHPNRKGIDAYVSCVQAKIDELEEKKEQSQPLRELSDERNVVLVLDNSGSMKGTPIEETRKASKKFIDTVLEEDASIGIVTFSSNALLRADFSKDAYYLKDTVEDIYPDSRTNTDAGLTMARDLLNGTEAKKKIIVLMSDGLANEGRRGESLISYAQTLKDEGIYIYTLGFFQGVSGSDRNSAQSLMERIASPGCHYEVADADHLVYFFHDIADQINGQPYVYIRIACPVDVEVTWAGEVLSSVTGSTRTSFGSLTFEEGEGVSYSGDNRTKILRLRDDGSDYQIKIQGNGEGMMHFTAGFMDDNGEYTDLREIADIPITALTRIDANADRNDATILRVDEDGDGDYDKTYREGGPNRLWWVFLLAGVALGAGVTAVIVLLRKRKTSVKRTPKARPAPVQTVLPPRPVQTAPVQAARPTKPARPTPAQPARPPKPMNTAGCFCGNCGAKNDGSSEFCGACGARLNAQKPAANVKFCGFCGTKNDTASEFCGSCGRRL